MDSPPKTKHFWMPGFVVHASRGLVRDQNARRKTMFLSLLIALVLLFAGSTFLQPLLIEHPVWFILYWLACVWLMFLAVLLAIFDLLITRLQTRAAARLLREQYSTRSSPNGAPPADDR
jgi:hypothetical protein